MSFDDDDDIVFPWEEGAPPAKHPINFEVASNPEKIKPTARKAKRSSILKSASDSASDRTALQDIVNSPKKKRSSQRASLSRRVSFSAAHHVKEFCEGKDELTVWNRTYEEERERSGNGSNISQMETTCNVDKLATLKHQNVGNRDMSGMELTQQHIETDATHLGRKDFTCVAPKDMDVTCAVPVTLDASCRRQTNADQNLKRGKNSMNMTSMTMSKMQLTTCNSGMAQDIVDDLDVPEMEMTECLETRLQTLRTSAPESYRDESLTQMTGRVTSSPFNYEYSSGLLTSIEDEASTEEAANVASAADNDNDIPSFPNMSSVNKLMPGQRKEEQPSEGDDSIFTRVDDIPDPLKVVLNTEENIDPKLAELGSSHDFDHAQEIKSGPTKPDKKSSVNQVCKNTERYQTLQDPVQCAEKVVTKQVVTSSDLKLKVTEEKKNIREISIFTFLLEKQNAVSKENDQTRYGRFQIAELDLVEGQVIFSFTNISLRLVIRLGHPLPNEEIEDAISDRGRTIVKHWTIRAMQFENPSRLMKRKNGDKSAKLAHFLLLRQLTSSWFHEVCPNTCSLNETLSKVSGCVHEAACFVIDMFDISTSHSEFSVSDDYKIKIGFHNIKLYFAFTIEIDFSQGFRSAKNPENVNIQMKSSLYKNVKIDSIMQLVQVVPPGWKYTKILVKYIDTYCQELSAGTQSTID